MFLISGLVRDPACDNSACLGCRFKVREVEPPKGRETGFVVAGAAEPCPTRHCSLLRWRAARWDRAVRPGDRGAGAARRTAHQANPNRKAERGHPDDL